MPRMLDAGEFRQGLVERIGVLLNAYGGGSDQVVDEEWRIAPAADGLVITNRVDATAPRFFVHVEMDNVEEPGE